MLVMAVGQQVLSAAEDLAVLDAAMLRLECRELTRGAEHAGMLREALELQRVLVGSGMAVSTVPQLALALSASEARAGQLLAEAEALVVLPGAIEAVEAGLLTIEQSRTVIDQLKVLPLPDRVAVWRRLQARLIGAADGLVQPPARLADTLRRWVIAQDRQAAEQRRREAQQDRRVEFRSRADGLHELFALGMTGPDRLAIGARIAARSTPWGSEDDRTADQRRYDAFRDLLLGRDQLPIVANDTPLDPNATGPCTAGLRAAGAAPCGCLPGSPVPCGAEVSVLLPVGAGLGTTDELAELVGHGPLEPDLTEALLLNAPRLRPVWVDEHGVPVAVGDRTVQLGRGDARAVRESLLALQALPPPTVRHPRHPLDHRTISLTAQSKELPAARGRSLRDEVTLATAALGGSHPAGSPGPYRVGRRLRRLLEVRAPRCEWPGCGAKAVRCDAEHDIAWTGDDSGGPTCACNLGPCCRRHHRVKQLGWTKTRGSDTVVTWTDLTGRRWHSPSPHDPPQPALRPPPPIPSPHDWEQLSPEELDDELFHLDLLPDDPGPWTTPLDIEPADDTTDRLAERILHNDLRWTLDLDDPHRWLPEADLTDV